jgi:hypothetical protein
VASGASPSALLDAKGASHTFARGPQDVIYTANLGSGGWAGFFEIGDGNDHAASGTTIAPTAVPGRIYVLIRGPSGGVYVSSRAA